LRAVTARLSAALAFVCLGLLLGGGAYATPPLSSPPASAQGVAVQLVGPDQTVIAATPEVDAPPTGDPVSVAFAHPADGSIVSTESTSVTTSASALDGTAEALSEVTTLSLFGGEITADSVRASVSSAGTVGDLSDSAVGGFVVLGQAVTASASNTRIPLGDWGYALLLGQTTAQGSSPAPSWRGTVTALVIHLDLDHGGLAAGTEIRIGFADAYAQPPVAPPTTTRVATETRPAQQRERPTRSTVRVMGATAAARAVDAPLSAPSPFGPGPLLVPPSDVTPKLTAHRYVFPVYGPSAYGDTFGAPRPDVSGGWHHGDDIFAPLGAPILAVADGTVFSVGWNDVGGYRLWLRDEGGNEFYYAHLSAYTTLAVNGRRVRAGDVLGFVGNTGDAESTPFHVHFELHPVSMLFLGYDGAVNPTTYLDAWKRLEDVRILPAIPFGPPDARTGNAPTPGAILLESADISTANGLDPGSLTRAMNRPPTVDPIPSGVSGLPVPLPVLDRA
jgi:murein DD-endopeptidase MepM/ murein hydrolase activator NlpD